MRPPNFDVHMTDLERRETRSVLAAEADGLIVGLGLDSHRFGPEALLRVVARPTSA